MSGDIAETLSAAKQEQPSIVLFSPNGGERFRTGQLVTIKWRTSGLETDPTSRKYLLQLVAITEFPHSQYVKSYVSTDGSPTNPSLLLAGNGEGEFPWRVELSRSASVDRTLKEFRIKIRVNLIERSGVERSDNRTAIRMLATDESDEWFTVIAAIRP